MTEERLTNLVRFYSILDQLETSIGGALTLADCSVKTNWPSRGVYFFREFDEHRTESGQGPRIVRVGTHALKAGAPTKLWTRLSQHKGHSHGGGNERGSIFRQIVGAALIDLHAYDCPTWGVGNTASREVRELEQFVECKVSNVIRSMPFLWLGIDDEAGPDSVRGYIERNSIALPATTISPHSIRPQRSGSGIIAIGSEFGVQACGIHVTSMSSMIRVSSMC
jgi:hypothetical protein